MSADKSSGGALSSATETNIFANWQVGKRLYYLVYAMQHIILAYICTTSLPEAFNVRRRTTAASVLSVVVRVSPAWVWLVFRVHNQSKECVNHVKDSPEGFCND